MTKGFHLWPTKVIQNPDFHYDYDKQDDDDDGDDEDDDDEFDGWMVSLKVGDDEVFPEEVFKGHPDLSIPPAFCQSTQGGTPPPSNGYY